VQSVIADSLLFKEDFLLTAEFEALAIPFSILFKTISFLANLSAGL
jgi:hypothetical protein